MRLFDRRCLKGKWMGNQYLQSFGWIKQSALSDNIEMVKELWPEELASLAVHLILFHVNHLFSKYLTTG